MECSCSDRSLRADSWDLSIYVHLTPEASLRRGVARDSLLMEEAQRLRRTAISTTTLLDKRAITLRPHQSTSRISSLRTPTKRTWYWRRSHDGEGLRPLTVPQGVPSECRTAPTNRRSVGASLPLSFRSRLQDADDQEKHKCQHDDANNKNTQRVAPGTKVIVVSAPVPLVGIIRVGRYRTYWRGHRPSVGSGGRGDRTPRLPQIPA